MTSAAIAAPVLDAAHRAPPPRRPLRDGPLDAALQAVLDALFDWSGPAAHDDVTLVLAKVH